VQVEFQLGAEMADLGGEELISVCHHSWRAFNPHRYSSISHCKGYIDSQGQLHLRRHSISIFYETSLKVSMVSC
jgi:hypothetical protein